MRTCLIGDPLHSLIGTQNKKNEGELVTKVSGAGLSTLAAILGSLFPKSLIYRSLYFRDPKLENAASQLSKTKSGKPWVKR
jgi:hypothetical protein